MHYTIDGKRLEGARPYNLLREREGSFLLHVQTEDVVESWELDSVGVSEDVLRFAYADQDKPISAFTVSELLPVFRPDYLR